MTRDWHATWACREIVKKYLKMEGCSPQPSTRPAHPVGHRRICTVIDAWLAYNPARRRA